ncbi:MAG: glycosyltransferase [Mycobacteriaceae bacterium]|nr:glycosyltransferase [Mycobacteriaceae bacterium]
MVNKKNANRVLLITLEPVSKAMAGPAIRCLELGKQLALEMPVTVASPVECRPEDQLEVETQSNLQIKTGLRSRTALYNLALEHDIWVIQSNVLRPFPRLASLALRHHKYVVVDLYDPYLFSILVQYKHDKIAGPASFSLMHQLLEFHMRNADFSICASERQRDYWLGRYCAIGKITPEVYEFDSSCRKLIDVVPFGLNPEPAQRTGPGIRGTVDGIGADDLVLLWGGGIWDWFDPITVIKAVEKASQTIPNIRLYFMGMKSPNPKVPLMKMATDACELARSLGVLDKTVFFGEGWVEYNQRVNLLLDADVAVSAHFDLIETRFSFRTRTLDYLWAGLPVLSTGGDQLSEAIESVGAGRALPYGDVDAWCDAILKLASDREYRDSCRQASSKLSAEYTWDKTARTLVEYCRNPHKLPAFEKINMPTLLDRAKAVYARGGRQLVLQRSREILGDMFQ